MIWRISSLVGYDKVLILGGVELAPLDTSKLGNAVKTATALC